MIYNYLQGFPLAIGLFQYFKDKKSILFSFALQRYDNFSTYTNF